MKRKVITLLSVLLVCTCVFAAPSFSSFNRAVSQGNVSLVKRYISQGVDVNAVDSYGNTVLFTEIQKDDDASAEMVRVLIEAGLDPEIGEYDGDSALIYAINYCPEDVIMAILDSPSVDVLRESYYGETSVLTEVYKGENASADVVERLIELGADPEVRSRWGESAVSYAEEYKLTHLYGVLGINAGQSNTWSGTSVGNSKIELNIPSWVQGEWKGYEANGESGDLIISVDDIIVVESTGERTSLISEMNDEMVSSFGIEIIEDETPDTYTMSVGMWGFNVPFMTFYKTNNSNALILGVYDQNMEENKVTVTRKGTTVNVNNVKAVSPSASSSSANSSSSSSSSSSSKGYANLNIPAWAQGTWKDSKNSDKYIIKSNDILLSTYGSEISIFVFGDDNGLYTIKGEEIKDGYKISMSVFGFSTPFVTLKKTTKANTILLDYEDGETKTLVK